MNKISTNKELALGYAAKIFEEREGSRARWTRKCDKIATAAETGPVECRAKRRRS